MTEPDKNSLSQRQSKALPFFAACTTYEAACQKASISRNTFYEWLKNPHFKEALNQLRESIHEETVGVLKNCASEAVGKLVSLMRNSANENVQRLAANDILTRLSKFRELEEIEERICLLEVKVGVRKPDQW